MNLKRILRIARWEVTRESGFLTRRTLVLALVVALTIGGIVTTVGVSQPDSDLYTVGVSSDSPYEQPLHDHSTIRVIEHAPGTPAPAQIDAYVYNNGTVQTDKTDTGRAAAHEVFLAVESYNYKMMSEEANQSAAFPVLVSVDYVAPEQQELVGAGAAAQQSESAPEETAPDGDSGSQPTTNTTAPTAGGLGGLGSSDSGVTPTNLNPPLPFQSLLFAFAILIPLNFISQVYASSLIAERDRNRGEMLLVSPATQYDIIIGKTLPYLGFATVIVGAIIAFAGGGLISLLGVMPLVLMFLAFSFLASSFARSYKELSFFTLGASVLLTTYAFIPAIFTQVHPISSITPLSIVVADLQNIGFDTGRVLMGTIPLFFTGSVMFVFGIETYEEEFLFSQESLPAKFLAMVANQVVSLKSVFILGALSIPFIFVVELLVLAGLIAVPSLLSLPLLLLILAFIEEVGKSLPIYAGTRYRKISLSWKSLFLAGALSGFGFFLAEKIFVLAQQAGLNSLQLGSAAFETALTPAFGGSSVLAIVLLGLWPFLHSLTTVISTLGMRKGRVGYAVGLLLATVVHVAYNLTAVILYG